MGRNYSLNVLQISDDPRSATKLVADVLFTKIYPLMLGIRNKLHDYDGALFKDEIKKMHDVFTLCSSQIKKCLQILFEIFKTEYHQQIFLQDSRQCILDRLSWCVTRLIKIEQHLDDGNTAKEENFDNSFLATPMYFVNWIDHTFEVLTNLANAIYKTDYKDSDDLYDQWKNDMADCVSTLHISLDELLLSAMTLCRHCLPSDQHIIRARCQVVLRETKALLSELVEGDLDAVFKATPDTLKLPIMPSNVNVLIDVLKDVLYVLETNTNTALLALLVHCFSYNVSPVDVLKGHFGHAKGTCSCLLKSEDDVTEDCSFVKDFDSYNERLLQIGSFAVSCSSDQFRVLTLRSGLASLEALDSHLVPALMLSPDSHHANLLMNSWRQEVQEIRDSVFLIVDPAAFAEKSKQMMHQILLEIMRESSYNNSEVCSVINIGSVVHDFFSVYNNHEPDALTHHDKLAPLLTDLNKVQIECKIVSNILSSDDDFVYDLNKETKNNKEASMDQLLKRLKLLYTLVNKINCLLHPRENDDQSFDCDLEEDPPVINKNLTHTVNKDQNTYVNSPRNPANNISRSIFARTRNLRSSTTRFPLSTLTKHLKAKRDELSFSVKLDELFNLSETAEDIKTNVIVNKNMDIVRERSILYDFSPKKRSSLRKAVLNKFCKLPFDKEDVNDVADCSMFSGKESLTDEATSLQITDILNQMSDMTNIFSKTKPESTQNIIKSENGRIDNKDVQSNVLKINVNNTNTNISRHIWNIPVNASSIEIALDDSGATMACNTTQPSNVTTLERINDIDLVETKLSSLKSIDLETSLFQCNGYNG